MATPEQVIDALSTKLRAGGWTVSLAKRRPIGEGIPRGAHGSTMYGSRKVWIEKRDPELMASTFLHEAAHVITVPLLMDIPGAGRADGEVIAESAAMLAGEKLGVHDPESDEYIGGWLGDTGATFDTLAQLSVGAGNELVRVVEDGGKS